MDKNQYEKRQREISNRLYALTTDNLNDRIVESETDENNTLNIKGKHPTDHRAITMTLQMKRAHKPEIIHIWKKGNPEK